MFGLGSRLANVHYYSSDVRQVPERHSTQSREDNYCLAQRQVCRRGKLELSMSHCFPCTGQLEEFGNMRENEVEKYIFFVGIDRLRRNGAKLNFMLVKHHASSAYLLMIIFPLLD